VQILPARFEELRELFAELDADLSERYGPGEHVRVAAEEFEPPVGRLLLACQDEMPVGCAGVRPLPDFGDGIAELKRMYVRPAARRQGVARELLRACEEAARELGYRQLWLETGTRQAEAVALYSAAGYEPVARFGQYKNSPGAIYLGRGL
jgi:GNAT superfamily N-acetyltransferase